MVRVLQSFNEPKGDDNPFLQLSVSSLPNDIECLFFSWRTALLGRYDVFHVHWVDSLVAGRSRLQTATNWAALSLLLLRLRLTRTPVVRTFHNRSVRGGRGRAVEKLLRGALDNATVTVMRMNSDRDGIEHARSVRIPHGHYRDWYSKYSVPERIQGRVLNFGLIRDYKGLDQLLPAFAGISSDAASLHVVGKILDAGLGSQMTELSVEDPRFTVIAGHASEATLAKEIGECELVVLPYDELYNSGCLFLALSLSRPVVVPEGVFATELQSEIGEGWIYTYPGSLDSEKLADAMKQVSSDQRADAPDLSGREWKLIGSATADVYRSAVGSRS